MSVRSIHRPSPQRTQRASVHTTTRCHLQIKQLGKHQTRALLCFECKCQATIWNSFKDLFELLEKGKKYPEDWEKSPFQELWAVEQSPWRLLLPSARQTSKLASNWAGNCFICISKKFSLWRVKVAWLEASDGFSQTAEKILRTTPGILDFHYLLYQSCPTESMKYYVRTQCWSHAAAILISVGVNELGQMRNWWHSTTFRGWPLRNLSIGDLFTPT